MTGVLNEFVVRLPSAIAGIVAVWATVRLGGRLWSAKTGRIAGWFLLTTYAFLFWARTGTADAENLAAIVLAVAWYWSIRDRLSFSSVLVFYLIAFVGALTKGLTAVVVPILIVLPDMLAERRWRVLFSLKHLGAFVLALLVYLFPFVYASLTRPADYQSSGLALVFQENILRYFKPLDHKGPIYLYVYQLPVLLLPWTPLFVLAAIGMAKCRKSLDRHSRWLMWAIVLVFLFFSLSGSRRSYYILPILPLCALLMAVFVVWMRQLEMDGLRQRALAIQRVLFIGVTAFDLAIPVVLTIIGRITHYRVPLSFYVASLSIGVAAFLFGVGIGRFVRGPSPSEDVHGAIQPWIGVAVVLLGGYFCWQQNILEANRTERPFARQLQERIAALPSIQVRSFPKCNANILFYLDDGRHVDVLPDADGVRSFIEGSAPGVLIAQQRYAAGLPAEITARLQRQESLREDMRPWESKSSKEERWVRLVLEGSCGCP